MSDLQINIQEAPALVIEIAGVGVPAGAASVSEAQAQAIAEEVVGRMMDDDPNNDPYGDLPDFALLFENQLI